MSLLGRVCPGIEIGAAVLDMFLGGVIGLPAVEPWARFMLKDG